MNLVEGNTGAAEGFFDANTDEMVQFYRQHGFVIRRGLIAQNSCSAVTDAFDHEVRGYAGYIYRQTTANPERHVMDACGRMMNPILNPLSLRTSTFPSYKSAVSAVLASDNLFGVVHKILGHDATLVQSMYFEGGLGTWAHQDTYYLDSEKLGSMVAAWIALEDIDEGAGRFFVGMDSHKIDMVKNGGDFDIAFNHDRYKKLVLDVIKSENVRIISPALKKGDVLLWNGKTIHGSHAPTNVRTRRSLTAHFIPSDHRFLQLQSRIKNIKPGKVNGHSCYSPKNQDILLNRAVLAVETTFPEQFKWCKRKIVKLITGR